MTEPTDSPKEDAATKATREELKHTAISDKRPDLKPSRDTTPEGNEELRDQVSSPKKKRAHDEVDKDDDAAAAKKTDESRKAAAPDAGGDAASASTAADSAAGEGASRSDGAEPDKKRPRDKQPDPTNADITTATTSSAFASSGFAKLSSSASPFGALAGAASPGKSFVFGSALPTASPFAALGASASSTTAPAASAAPLPVPKLTFGGGASAASPFASLQAGTSKSVFGNSFGASAGTGSAFGSVGGSGSVIGGGMSGGGGGFGSSLLGPRLSSFAKPGGEPFKSGKPAKPFGAPESDADDSGDDNDVSGDEGDENEGGDEKEGEAKSEAKKPSASDDKKKIRLQRVTVDDGEAGEATILQVRCRMYYVDKELGGWKERGAGMLKINVPERCVDFDRDGSAIAASFDASTLNMEKEEIREDEEDEADSENGESGANSDTKSDEGSAKGRSSAGQTRAVPARNVVRLIMRQDSTHRVILNTVVLAAAEFQERQTLKASTILFTAFEGPIATPVSVQVKMSVANAKTFLTTMAGVQKELRDQ